MEDGNFVSQPIHALYLPGFFLLPGLEASRQRAPIFSLRPDSCPRIRQSRAFAAVYGSRREHRSGACDLRPRVRAELFHHSGGARLLCVQQETHRLFERECLREIFFLKQASDCIATLIDRSLFPFPRTTRRSEHGFVACGNSRSGDARMARGDTDPGKYQPERVGATALAPGRRPDSAEHGLLSRGPSATNGGKSVVTTRDTRSGATRTAHDLWRTLASFGGSVKRKGDGPPGWQTVWKIWLSVHTVVQGVHLAARFSPPSSVLHCRLCSKGSHLLLEASAHTLANILACGP